MILENLKNIRQITLKNATITLFKFHQLFCCLFRNESKEVGDTVVNIFKDNFKLY